MMIDDDAAGLRGRGARRRVTFQIRLPVKMVYPKTHNEKLGHNNIFCQDKNFKNRQK